MSNSIRFLFLILISISLQFTVFAQEETAKIKKLSREADIIVTGKVTQKESSWNESKTRIYTRTTIQVDEYLKGSNEGTFVDILHPGGEVGEVGEIYSHMPRFEEDEDILVFLKKDSKKKDYLVVNGEEGKIALLKKSNSNEKTTSLNVSLKEIKSQIKNYLKDQ
jgi:hypothetical protein